MLTSVSIGNLHHLNQCASASTPAQVLVATSKSIEDDPPKTSPSVSSHSNCFLLVIAFDGPILWLQNKYPVYPKPNSCNA
jgi:hypothetical protein